MNITIINITKQKENLLTTYSKEIDYPIHNVVIMAKIKLPI